MCASLSPTNDRTGPCAPSGCTVVASQTWLAQPCTLLRSLRSRSSSGAKLAAELDHIAVAVVPIVEHREVVDDGVDMGGGAGRRCVGHAHYIGEKRRRNYGRTRDSGLQARAPLSEVRCNAVRAHIGHCRGAVARLRAAPRRRQIGRTQRVLRRLRRRHRCRSTARSRGLVVAEPLVEEFVEHLGADLRALPERRLRFASRPRKHSAAARRIASCRTSAAFAAENASPALTCDFGTGCEPPLGSKIRTTPSQNATRNRNRI